METLLIVLGVTALAWFSALMWLPRRARTPDSDGFVADPALTGALDEAVSDNARFRGYP